MKRFLGVGLLATACLACRTAACGEAAAFDPRVLPEKILSGYSGGFLDEPEVFLSRFKAAVDEMGKRGFNSIDWKIQQTGRTFDLEPRLDVFREAVAYANAHGLVFQVYLYPHPGNAVRSGDYPGCLSVPAVVDASGTLLESRFLISDARFWKTLFSHAYAFARHRADIPIAALKFDVETIPWLVSYDDVTWASFCRKNGEFDANLPAARRRGALESGNAVAKYEKHFMISVARAAKAFVDELHAIDPKLSLGYMPAGVSGPFQKVFNRILATPVAPAVADGWDMYNGGGYVDSIAETAAELRRLNPNNRYVSWFRPNSYNPTDIAPSAYRTCAFADGYSLWDLYMFLPPDETTPSAYRLPTGTTADDFYAAFGKANAAVRADLRQGTAKHPCQMKRVPFKAPRPMVASLDLTTMQFPDYVPAGDGSGEDREVMLRDPETIYIYAKSGDDISVSLWHAAGAARSVALQYALLGPKGKTKLRNEAIMPGERETFHVAARETGLHALAVSGGEEAGAWYAVNVHGGLHWGIATTGHYGAYFFGPQKMWLPGKACGNAKFNVWNCGDQAYFYSLNGADPVKKVFVKDLLLDSPSDIVEISFSEVPGTAYAQDFGISFPGGRLPLVWPVRERRLVLR